MCGVIFLKMIYVYRQKTSHSIELTDRSAFYERGLNDIQPFKNRFYATSMPFVSLNRNDRHRPFTRTYRTCLVVEKHDHSLIDTSDIQSRFTSSCSIEYRNLRQIFVRCPSEHGHRQLLQEYTDHPLYKVEEYHWLKHAAWIKYGVGASLVMTGISIFFLVKYHLVKYD